MRRSDRQSAAGQELAPGRGFWFMRDIPTVLWLAAAAAAAIFAAKIPVPRWLIIHLLLLGAITHAILVWSQYFSFALLRSRASLADRRTQNTRLILANLGALAVLCGVPSRLWPLTALGTALLIAAVLWHGWSMFRRLRRSLPGRFGRTIRFSIAAALFLAIGVLFGAITARGVALPGLGLAHALVNVLGWIGLTVAGTLVTLWPTVLRTRADAFAARGASQALPVLVIGIIAAASGALLGTPGVLLGGLLLYLTGLGIIGVSGWREARTAPPRTFAARSMAAAYGWWIASLTWIVVLLTGDLLLQTGTPMPVHLRTVIPFLAAGFAVQILIGALSYLVPVVLGGGPRPVRVGAEAFDRWGGTRVVLANLALCAWALPLPTVAAPLIAAVYLLAVASFLPIMFLAMRAQRIVKRGNSASPAAR